MKTFSAGIIAGGRAERFGGRVKALLTIGGKTLIERIAGELKGVAGEIIVSTDKVDICRAVGEGIICTMDLIPGRGPLSGIHGVLARASFSDVFVCAADMPYVSAGLVSRMYRHFLRGRRGGLVKALVPRYRVCLNNAFRSFMEPLFAFYGRELVEEMADYLIRSSRPSVHDFLRSIDCDFFDVGEEEIEAFTNINTPLDYEKLKKSYGINEE